MCVTLTLDAQLVNPSPHLEPRSRRIISSNRPSSKVTQSQTPILPAQKTMRKFEQGRYTATDVRWGMTLDLSGADSRSLIAFEFHGRENQQARAPSSAATVQEADRCIADIDPTFRARAHCGGAVLKILQIYLHRHVHVHRTVVGVPSLAVQAFIIGSVREECWACSSLFGT